MRLFKKKRKPQSIDSIHEPIEQQIADVKKLDPFIASIILQGESCDCLKGATGPFGSISNPIPVNGAIGEIKYLGKLRGKTGHAVFFHRICSLDSEIANHRIDKFELVCMDGTQWNNLYFDIYHPRRSNLVPDGYILTPYNNDLKMDIPYAYGTNEFVGNFPYDLPKKLEELYGLKSAFSKHAKKWLDQYTFDRRFNESQNGDGVEDTLNSSKMDGDDDVTFIYLMNMPLNH